MDILLTNDDGYDSYGLHALADALETLGTVTIVAPETDQSATGRTHSSAVQVTERERGYSIAGTPVDCILVGTEVLTNDPDFVVAGCNQGANLGGHTLARSGTVSAAVEATFRNIPAIAISLYIPESDWPLEEDDPSLYPEAQRAATVLLEKTMSSTIYDDGGYLNVNVPLPSPRPSRFRVTMPSTFYSYAINEQDGRISISDRSWDAMEAGKTVFEPGSDRSVVMNGDISVSPLQAPHESRHQKKLQQLIGA